MSSEPDRNLEARIAQLEDQNQQLQEEVQELKQGQAVTDENGETWTPSDLMSLGLSRRQAIAALGILAFQGGTIWAAIATLSQDVAAAAASKDTSGGTVGDSTTSGGELDLITDQLRDPGGDVFLNVDDSSGINAQHGRTWHFGSLEADELDVTNEVLIEVQMDNNQSLSSNTWETVDFDTENDDVTNDYDLANNQFSPPEDGYYAVTMSVTFGVVSDTDVTEVRFRNTTDSTNVNLVTDAASGQVFNQVQLIVTKKLLASKTYEPQARNANSNDTLQSGDGRTQMSIERVVLA